MRRCLPRRSRASRRIRSRGARGRVESFVTRTQARSGWRPRTDGSPPRPGDEVVVADAVRRSSSGRRSGEGRGPRREEPAPRPGAPDDTLIAAYLVDRDAPDTRSTTSRVSTVWSSCRCPRPRRRRPRSSGAPRQPAGSHLNSGRDYASGASSSSTTRSSCRSPRCSRTWRTQASGSTPTAWARSPRVLRTRRGARGQAFEHAGEEFQLGSTQQLARILFEKLGLASGRKGRPATRPTPGCCVRSAKLTRSCRSSRSGAS